MIGRRIRRIDTPEKELLALTLDGRDGANVLVFRLSGTPRGAGLVAARPRGAAADAFTRRLRKLLEGAVIREAGVGPGERLRLQLERGDDASSLLLDADERNGRVWVLGPLGELVAARDGQTEGLAMRDVVPDAWVATDRAVDVAALRARGPAIVDGVRGDGLSAKKRALGRALTRAARRLEHRQVKIDADAARANEAEPLRTRAADILSGLHAYVPGSAYLDVIDHADDPPGTRRISIDPAKGAKAEVEALYRKARRLERGAVLSRDRARLTKEELAVIAALSVSVERATTEEEVDALAEQAARSGVRGARASASPAKSREAPTRKPYRRFGGHGGRAILVGRGAGDNDALTLRHTKPSDLWLHARGQRGAHVIVPLARGEDCPPELLLDAATLAVHFSAAKGEDRVEVQHTPKRHVRKPRGAAPGSVIVERERVLTLRHEPDRLARLIASEERD
jgi:predicted ribosome quality control (RQC) complex YloA/Tae2 family protein